MATHPPSEKPTGMDEEQGLSRQAPTNGDSNGSPAPPRSGNLESTPKRSLPRAAWDRFNGYGRKPVGTIQSIKAVALSSCTSFPVAPGCSGINS